MGAVEAAKSAKPSSRPSKEALDHSSHTSKTLRRERGATPGTNPTGGLPPSLHRRGNAGAVTHGDNCAGETRLVRMTSTTLRVAG